MNSSLQPLPRRTFLLTLCCALGLAVAALPAAQAADAAKPADHAAKALPLAPTFEKIAGAATGPQYVLKLKNTSAAALKASAKIQLSVVAHNAPKFREVPAQTVAAGQVMTITELSSLDKVMIHAEGFAPLELTVP